MKPRVLTPFFFMFATMASAIRLSFCVVLNTQRFFSSIGNTTAGVPTGASMGIPASARVGRTATALGEPDGPISASMFCSLISFFVTCTACVGSDASSY